MFLKWIKVIDGIAGGINLAAKKLFGKSLDNSLAYAFAAAAAASGAKTVLRGTDLRGSVKANFENRKEFIQSRISKLEESGVKGTDNDAYGGYCKRKQERAEEYPKNITNLMTKAGLPNKGGFRFIPGKEVKLNEQLDGYVDKFGNLWVKGPCHGDPSKNFQFEWDVQLSEKGMKEWGKYTKNGKKYINVAPDGTLSH